MKLSGKRLQVLHFPQITSLNKAFAISVKDEVEAIKIINTLADQHIWLFNNKLIPDYSNSFLVEMWDGNEWVEYWNEEEQMNWDDFEAVYENEIISQID